MRAFSFVFGRPSKLAAKHTPLSLREWTLLAAFVAYGLVLRSWDLGSQPLRVDEAESSINALTILQHGVPVDHYLGLPIFENTLTRPWPESAEYEFRDSSYSEKGLAIYHGWLPLYAIAASFALTGVHPDENPQGLTVQRSAEEMHQRTVAARAPSIFFAALFLVALYFAARELSGKDAGWAALAAGVVCEPAIYFARQARYYSATLALGAACALMICLMVRRGRWRDVLVGAVFFVLLFHTHVLAFFSTCAAFGLALPLLLRHPQALRKLAVLSGIVIFGSFPWILWTGFAADATELPKARSLLGVEDIWAAVSRLGLFPLLALLAVFWPLVERLFRERLSDHVTQAFAGHTWQLLFLAGWLVSGFLGFLVFMPAVSYFYGRLVLIIAVPGILLAALLFAALARMIMPRHALFLAPCLFVLALAQAQRATFWEFSKAPRFPTVLDVIEHLRGLEIKAGARFYATPNDHLILTFYTGLPTQSIAPVRKSFLDQYEGDLWILEAGPRFAPLITQDVVRVISAAGHPVTEVEAEQWLPLLNARLLREELLGTVAMVTPALQPIPELFAKVLPYQRQKTFEAMTVWIEASGNPMFKGHQPPDNRWWPVFYYRFVGPESRMGPNLNYADRIKAANAIVLPSEWVLYQCPARSITREN